MSPLPRRGLFVLGGAAALALAGCSAGAPAAPGGPASGGAGSKVTVRHAKGEIEVPAAPQRAVVFDTVSLDTLSALGITPVGAPSGVAFPQRLADHLKDVKGVGTLFEPDLEAVNALNPDLVIVGGRSAKAYDQVKDIAPTLDLTLPTGDPVAALKDRATILGTVWGKADEVKTRLAAIDARVAELKTQGANAGKGLIVMVSGGKLTAFAAGSRFGIIHDSLGLAEAATKVEIEGHGQQISFEFIAKANPDVLYVVDRDSAVGEEGAKAALQVLDTPLVKNTNAGRANRIVELEGRSWYILGNGLANLPVMLDQVAKGYAAA